MRYTLDTNCLIALDRGEVNASRLRRVIDEEQACVVAIAAAERQRDDVDIDNFGKFALFLRAIGLARAEILLPPLYVGLGYVGHCVVVADASLEEEIHRTLFPKCPFLAADLPLDQDPMRGRWRNNKCDVLTAWCHIHYGCDVLVTADSNFHKPIKKRRLEALGAGAIVHPQELPE